MDSADATSASFRFMDLPPEVRKMIYDCFATVPTSDAGSDEEFKAITKTRTSLLSVSRQINAEWSTTFFRTTTIIVHGPRSEYQGFDGVGVYTGRPLCFDKFFLKSASASTVCSIRRLCYDASIHGPFGTVNHRLASTVNFPNLRQFARILDRSRTDLSSLQAVELYARWQGYDGGNRRPSVWDPTKDCSAALWARADEGGLWEEIVDLLVHRNRRAALKGWNVFRKVHVGHSIGLSQFNQIFSVHVSFSKRHAGREIGEAVTNPAIILKSMTDAHGHVGSRFWRA
jgi:hypothetical protein